MNLGTLTTWTAMLAGDPSQTRYSGQYTNAINEAQNQFALDSQALFKDQLYSVAANTSTYALPSDFMYEKLVVLSATSPVTSLNSGTVLDPISRARLQFYTRDHDWGTDTGTPRMYIIDPSVASGTNGNLVLYPQPQGADSGTNNLIMTYFPYPTVLVNSTDVPLNSTSNLQQFHIGIASWAAWLLLAQEIATQEVTTKRADLYKEYTFKMGEARDKYGTTSAMQWRLSGGRIWR